MADVAGVTHHLVLNSVGYMLRRTKDGLAWTRAEAPFLVPRQGAALSRDVLSRPETSSGQLLGGYGLDWGGGKYARGQGIDARLDGARAASSQSTVSSGGVQWSGGIDLPGVDAYLAGATGSTSRVYRYSVGGNSVAEQTGATASGALTIAFQNNGFVWFNQAGGAVKAMCVSNAGASLGPTATATTVAGARDSAYAWMFDIQVSTQKLHRVLLAGLTDVAGTWTGPTNALSGDVLSVVQSAFSYLGQVYLCRRDGVYSVTWDGVLADSAVLTRVIENRNFQTSTAFVQWTEFQGSMYFLLGDRVWKWTGGNTYENVSPGNFFVSTSGEGTIALAVRSLSAGKGWLWALAESDEATAGVYLLAYNGSRWEMIRQVVAGSGAAAAGIHASSIANRVLMSAYNGSSWSTYKMDLNTFGDRPASGTPATGNYCYLPGMDGGLPGESKLWRYVSVRGSGFSVSRPVAVEYWNGSSWTAAGSLNLAYGGTVTIPNGGYVDTRLLLRLDLQTDGTMSGAVREVSAGYVVLPDPIPMTEFEVLLGPVVRKLDGTTEARTPAQLLTALLSARASGQVVQLADPYTSAQGLSSRAVRIQEVEVKAMRPSPNVSGAYGWFATVRCIDV
ncbi:MAG: hypothetical protein U0822_16315 [Anaerolineae bacterium]